ncbi:MAG: S8 family serine peptidase [Solirubrobacterales bacterium]|nr:S8 family serine peptidase [Solirubrobacterales bacterium]
MRKRRVRVVLALGVSLALVGVFEVVPSASAGAQSQAAVNRVIVVLRNQVSTLPATPRDEASRRAAVARTQAPLTADLAASGARSVHRFTVLNAISATVSSAEEARLRTDGAVAEVVPDRAIRLAPLFNLSPGSAAVGAAAPTPGVCPPAGQVQLNPEALQAIHADSDNPAEPTARKLKIDGSGVTVGFIADGLDINNPDFIRPNGQHVFVDYKDFTGGGTSAPTGGAEAFGDAASIAAQGEQTYDAAGYGPDGVTTPCKIRVEGVAPGASLVGLIAVAGASGVDYNSTFLQAIDYAVTVDHVNVLSESLGINDYPDDQASLDLVKAADEAAVAAGTTVTVSSGDAGITNTVGTPASDPEVIAAGATTTYRSFLQSGYGGAQFPGVTGYLSNDISSLNSSGFEQSGRTIDVVAPGELNWSLCSTDVSIYQDCLNYAGKPSAIQEFGGTSEAAPLTAGVAALVYQAYAKTHGTWPDPRTVKQIITSTAQDIGSPGEQQGSGLVDAYQAVLAAESWQAPASTPTPTGDTLVKSPTQLNAIDQPATVERLSTTVTNNGASRQTIAVSSRTLGPYTQIASSKVTLSDATSPHTVDYAGHPSNYEPVIFEVPAGQDRLNAALAFQNASTTDLRARVRLTLVDPSGRLAAYSLPQGDGNYGDVQVTRPEPGRWTAYVWSREASNGGTNGPVLFSAAVARYVPFGRVTPSRFVLAPGQSAAVTLIVSTPATPGDAAGSIVFTSDKGPSFGRRTTTPVALRSLIPNRPTSFQQTLTGGNGRQANTGQTFYYQLNVPAGRPELNVAVTLANNPNNPFTMFLISPSGQALGQGANELPNSTPPGYTNELGSQVHVLSPAPGAWTVIVVFAPQVSGTAITEPFTVSTSETAVPASAPGLPDSSAIQLAAGKPYTYQVQIRNPTAAPAAYFIDARLSNSATLNLVALNGATIPVPLTGSDVLPLFLVPTHTTAIYPVAQTAGPTPIEFDAQAPAGDPDIGSTTGTSVAGMFTANPVAPGAWDIAPDVVGPFDATGVPSENVTTAMTTTSSAFDPSVSSATGDLWQASADPSALTGLSPVIIGPGQTGTIAVTITPQGSAGSHISGTLYVDVEDLFAFQVNPNVVNLSTGNPQPNGSEVAAIPYSYTVR